MKISFIMGATIGATVTAMIMKKSMSGNSMYEKGKNAVKKKIDDLLE